MHFIFVSTSLPSIHNIMHKRINIEGDWHDVFQQNDRSGWTTGVPTGANHYNESRGENKMGEDNNFANSHGTTFFRIVTGCWRGGFVGPGEITMSNHKISRR